MSIHHYAVDTKILTCSRYAKTSKNKRKAAWKGGHLINEVRAMGQLSNHV